MSDTKKKSYFSSPQMQSRLKKKYMWKFSTTTIIIIIIQSID